MLHIILQIQQNIWKNNILSVHLIQKKFFEIIYIVAIDQKWGGWKCPCDSK